LFAFLEEVSMKVQLVLVPSVNGTAESGGRTGGLAAAADAYVEDGFLEELPKRGIAVAGSARPVLAEGEVTDDPIVNLGRYNALVADAVKAGVEAGAQPVLLGGTCSHLIGMISGLQQAYGATSRIGLLWFDAHGDFNTPRTTRSGMLGGMPVAVAAGLCHREWRELAGQVAPLPTDRIVIVDVRNLDPDEATLIAATDVQIARFGADGEIDEIETAVADLAKRVDHLYLHVDADVLDASEQPNHPTAEPNGPSLAATNAALAAVMATGLVRAFGVVSVNPTGPEGAVSLRSGIAMISAGLAAWSEEKTGVSGEAEGTPRV
jgi:arginase